MFKRRITTFINGIRSMRFFVGKRVPHYALDYWASFDESFWGFGPVYRSQPGGHFHFMFFAIGNRKVGFYDTN